MACPLCEGKPSEILDFGDVALAGAFLRPGQFSAEKKYRLRFGFCETCFTAQVMDPAPRDAMFRDYFYRSSAIKTLRDHFKAYAGEVVARFRPKSVLEIGCNDGVMLNPLVDLYVNQVVGIDPSNVTLPVKGATVISGYFEGGIGEFDVILANNVFAHVSDINALTRNIRDSLKPNGVFIFEVHDLSKMISGLQYDWIYHEHQFYHSLLSLKGHFERHGMTVFDVQGTGLHAGSRRYFVCKDRRTVEPSVAETLKKDEGLDKWETYWNFARRVAEHKRSFTQMLDSLPGVIAGYGACGRANTMIQYCDLKLEFIVDDAPAKQNLFTPGSHIPICSRRALETNPDYVVVFAWSFLNEIQPKCNSRLIVPLPEWKIITNRLAA